MNIAAFSSYIFLTAFTPGLNNIMAMTNAGKYGFKKGMRFCLGALLGFLVLMSGCAAFSALLFRSIPKIESVMKWIGAIYILFLAFTIYRDKPHNDKKGHLQTNSVFTGMMMQFINAKGILYGITALSTFVLPHYKSIPALGLFVCILSFTGFAGICVWALFGSIFQKAFTTHRKGLNIAMALLLVYCAVASVM